MKATCTHLAPSTVVSGTSLKFRIQNSVLAFLPDSMKEKVRKAPFVAVMLDETTDKRPVTLLGIRAHCTPPHRVEDDTVHCADGYITLLVSFNFCFWLKKMLSSHSQMLS